MSERYYDNNTGLLHVHTRESSYGFGSLDSKSIGINPQGTTVTADTISTLQPCKLIKADFRAQVEGIRGRLLVGVVDNSVDNAAMSELSDLDPYDGFPIDVASFLSSDEFMFNYRKVWKPNKYAQAGDADMFMTIDPTGFWGILTVWSYCLSCYSVWKPL